MFKIDRAVGRLFKPTPRRGPKVLRISKPSRRERLLRLVTSR